MEGQSSDSLKLTEMLLNVEPPETYGLDKQCIYRVPHRIRKTNPKAYSPRIVSIGPLHKARDVGKEDNILESMEEVKLKYLKGFLIRTELPMRHLVDELKRLEEDIRNCYAAPIEYNSDDFLKMILIDACFIIELFLRWHSYEEWEGNDPLLQKPWMIVDIQHDLILLENQLPFFVLEQLYNFTGMDWEFPSFREIAFDYLEDFNPGTVCPTELPKHFTDLLRSSIILSSTLFNKAPEESEEINHLYSVTQLLWVGLEFKADQNKCLVDLHYEDGVLTMPSFVVNDDTETPFRNIVAFEQCHSYSLRTRIITQYLKILDFLINNEKDVDVLVDKKIIKNWTGDTKAVATMVNDMLLNVAMPDFNPEYFSLCNGLNNFYENPRNKYMAILIHQYLNTPWKIASAVAAVVLLLLTLIQTICSIISLF